MEKCQRSIRSGIDSSLPPISATVSYEDRALESGSCCYRIDQNTPSKSVKIFTVNVLEKA